MRRKAWKYKAVLSKSLGCMDSGIGDWLKRRETIKIQHLWKYGSLHMDVTCTSMKASLMLDDKNILWCNIDREAHLSERKPNHTPHITAALLRRIALHVHHEHFCPECCCRLLTKQSCTGSPCITEYTKCESVRI